MFYSSTTTRYSILFIERSTNPLLFKDWIYYNLTPGGRAAKRHVETMREHTMSIIENRKSQLLRDQHCDLYDVEKRKFEPLIDILLKRHLVDKTMTEEEVRQEIETFTFAGFDTSALAIGYSLFNIGHHPEVERKLFAEVVKVCGHDTNEDIDTDQIRQMTYLDQVVKESLRLYPSVPVVMRATRHKMQIADHTIPGDTTLATSIYHVHRNPEIWPEPEKFDPERFSAENQAGRDPYAYIPFSAGPRNCIGQKFAMVEVKLVLAHVIRRFEIETLTKKEDLRLVIEIVLKPKTPIAINFKERSQL